MPLTAADDALIGPQTKAEALFETLLMFRNESDLLLKKYDLGEENVHRLTQLPQLTHRGDNADTFTGGFRPSEQEIYVPDEAAA